MPIPSLGAQLQAYLSPIAKQIREIPARRLIADAGECRTVRDYESLSVYAAFEAAIELGLDPDQPDAFNWLGKAGAVFARGRTILRNELQGSHTTYGDLRARRKFRRRVPAAGGWKAWDGLQATSAGSRRIGKGPSPTKELPDPEAVWSDEVPQDAVGHDCDCERLQDALKQILRPLPYWVLLQNVLRGVPLLELARSFEKAHPEYSTDAHNMLMVTKSRALAKARTLLAPHWREMARAG